MCVLQNWNQSNHKENMGLIFPSNSFIQTPNREREKHPHQECHGTVKKIEGFWPSKAVIQVEYFLKRPTSSFISCLFLFFSFLFFFHGICIQLKLYSGFVAATKGQIESTNSPIRPSLRQMPFTLLLCILHCPNKAINPLK